MHGHIKESVAILLGINIDLREMGITVSEK